MNVRLFEAARNELDAAIAYYNAERAGLGDELLVEFLHTIELIKNTREDGRPSISAPADAACAASRTA